MSEFKFNPPAAAGNTIDGLEFARQTEEAISNIPKATRDILIDLNGGVFTRNIFLYSQASKNWGEIAGNPQDVLASGGIGGVIISLDGGASWFVESSAEFFSSGMWCQKILITDQFGLWRIFVPFISQSGDGGVLMGSVQPYQDINGAQTNARPPGLIWSRLHADLENSNFTDVCEDDGGILALANTGLVVYSATGMSMVTLPLPAGEYKRILSLSDKIVLIGVQSCALSYRENNYEVWQTVTLPIKLDAIKLAKYEDGKLFIAGTAIVDDQAAIVFYTSEDDGATWTYDTLVYDYLDHHVTSIGKYKENYVIFFAKSSSNFCVIYNNLTSVASDHIPTGMPSSPTGVTITETGTIIGICDDGVYKSHFYFLGEL